MEDTPDPRFDEFNDKLKDLLNEYDYVLSAVAFIEEGRTLARPVALKKPQQTIEA